MPLELNVLALVKGQEQYIFVYDDVSHDRLLDAIRDQAADAGLSLTWFDALVLRSKALDQLAQVEPTKSSEQAARSRI